MAERFGDIWRDDRLAKRNALVLSAAQAFGGAAAPINMALSGLAGFFLLDEDKSLATVPVTFFIVGTALGAVPAALLMRAIGRRLGFISGMAVSVVGGLVAAYAMLIGSFGALCAGTLMMGVAAAFVQQFRFAAADTASPEFRPKAISWVLAGGVAAAVVGPQAAILFTDALAPTPFAGAYLASSGLSLVAILVLSFLHIPHVRAKKGDDTGRPLPIILAQPRLVVAILCAVGVYAMMSLVMTATPLAMVETGHTKTDATLGIQWHVIAMFGPSFFTGNLITRFGVEKIIAFGLVLLAACALVALSGVAIAHFYATLVLLGVGWNFGFIGATAMVAETYAPEEKAKVQAVNDGLLFGFVALASFSSGKLLVAYGWEAINLTVFPFVALCLVALAWLVLRTPAAELRRA